MPSGRFLMEDFYYAGGLPAVMRTLGEHGLLNRDALTVNGQTIWENCQRRAELERRGHPAVRQAAGGERRHRGAARQPRADGAVLKPSAASPQLMKHRGRAVVFETIEHYKARIADPALDVDATCVLVLKNCGPEGLSGHGGSRQHGPAAEGAASRASPTWSASPTRG